MSTIIYIVIIIIIIYVVDIGLYVYKCNSPHSQIKKNHFNSNEQSET